MIARLHILMMAAAATTVLAAPVFAADAPAAVSLASPRYGSWGFDQSGMDRSVRPGDDFFKFANGAWDTRTTIPSDRVRYGNFHKLRELSEHRMHAILEDAKAGKLSDPDAAKIAAGYAAFMDEALAEKLDAKPIAPALAQIRAVKSKAAFTALMAQANTTPFTTILPVGITTDAKAPNRYAVTAFTGGLGLPDRDYYLTPGFAEKKLKYQAYVAQILTLAGWADPQGAAKAVVAFETRLAEASWSRIAARDRDKTYNPMSPAELAAYAPGFDWKAYLAATDLPPKLDRLVVTTNTALPKFAKIYAETPLDTLKAWQAFHVADAAAPYLSKRF